jgi:hypothetical protein
MLKIRYNGRRFPRIVNLSGRQGTMSFNEYKRELLLSNYDANLLMTFNTRLNNSVWEFDVIEVVKDNDQSKAPLVEELKPESVIEKQEQEKPEPIIKKPAKRGRKKRGNKWIV